jgi:hypothetical protein
MHRFDTNASFRYQRIVSIPTHRFDTNAAFVTDALLSGERRVPQDIQNINELPRKLEPKALLALLGKSFAPSICGHDVRRKTLNPKP